MGSNVVDVRPHQSRHDRRNPVVGLLFFLSVLVIAACSNEKDATPTETSEAHGSIDIAVGGEVRTFELGAARCETVKADDDYILKVDAPAADTRQIDQKPTQPNLLSARLPADLDVEDVRFGPEQSTYGAIASVVDTEYEDEPYKLLQVIAQTVEGGPADYECRASREDDEISVICNDARVLPWFAAGPVPEGSFKASVGCEG